VLSGDELAELGDDDDAAKDLADATDFFLAEENMMQNIGRFLGTVLGPRGKMPDPIGPDDDVVEMVERMKNTVQMRAGNVGRSTPASVPETCRPRRSPTTST